MGSALHLRSQKLPISISDSKNHRLLALGHGPSNLSRAFNCLDYITNSDVFNGLVGAIGHQNRSAPANALHVVRAALVLDPVARLLDAAKLHHTAAGQTPDAVLAVVPVARAQNVGHAFLNAGQLHGLPPEHDGVLLRGQAQSQQEVSLSAAGRAAVENDVRQRFVGLGLRSRLRHPDRRVTDQQDGVQLAARILV